MKLNEIGVEGTKKAIGSDGSKMYKRQNQRNIIKINNMTPDDLKGESDKSGNKNVEERNEAKTGNKEH
jgi:hypothetical protein